MRRDSRLLHSPSHALNLDGTPLENDINVIDLLYSELLNYDFGISKSEEFKDTKIPTLSEILDFACETKMKLKFDNLFDIKQPSRIVIKDILSLVFC